jgi:C-terminal processing protease CtpA/Prc
MKPLFAFLLLTVPLIAQPLTRANVASILGFEDSQNGRLSARWNAGSSPDIIADSTVVHSGRYSARITRAVATDFTTIITSIPQDFAAQTLELRGYVKLENVAGNIALWLRQDGPAGSLGFVTLQTLNLRGTADWKEYSIQLRLQPNGRQIVFGFLVSGAGRAWADSLQLLADGKPIADAPDAAPTILVSDREFDNGSQINVSDLSDLQVENLATLANVWGFAKYHHPFVTAGNRHWDYELFRVMPAVLNAESADQANAAINDWLLRLGDPPACSPCPTLPSTGLLLPPDIEWINDAAALGDPLSGTLQTIYRRRSGPNHFFVSKVSGVGNPVFENELNYPSMRHPDSGLQLLALFRFWNMMQYFNPNRKIMGDQPDNASEYWAGTLRESIRPFAFATDRVSYQRALLLFIAKINDTHSNLWTGTSALPPMGSCYLPVDLRFVEGQLVVYRRTARDAAAENPLQVGDVITHLDGSAVYDLVNDWRPFYPASNEPTRLRDIARYAGRGACQSVALSVLRGEEQLNLSLTRLPTAAIDFTRSSVHDLPGDTFQKLAGDVAYLKLSSVRAADSASYIRQAEGTRGLIIDIRNYPSEFVVFTLGQLLVSERSPFATFTAVNLSNPGAFYRDATATLVPQAPRYTGKVVILVDEISQSQAEYTTMAFRTAPGAVVVGSTTAGADGNVSLIPLPGAQSSYISGIGVFYPDGRPTQRIGILPDVEMWPTVAGIRDGRDELVETAIRIIREQ